MEVYLGTGGYSNDDWLGKLYPEGTKSSDYLNIYAQHFNAVELNSSFYAIPGLKAFEGMVRKSEAKVRFAVKLNKAMTHDRKADGELYGRILESVEPLRDAGMLGPFLAQFPYSFHRTPENRKYLASLVEHFKDEHLAVEFRNQQWDMDEVRESFKQMGLVYVSVDYPQVSGMPAPQLYLTSDVAYVRMHGRNEKNWYGADSAAARHDYLYNKDELREWVADILARQEELSQVYVMMMNTTKGHALKNLATLKTLFEEGGVEVGINP